MTILALGALVGIAALLAVLIEIAKKFGIIPDGYAGWAAVIANISA